MEEVRKKSLKELLPTEEFEPMLRRANPGVKRRTNEISEADSASVENDDGSVISPPRQTRSRWPRNKKLIYLLAGLIVLIGGYWLSIVFSSASVNITPRLADVSLDGSYAAKRAPADGLEFSVVELSDSAEKTVAASGQTKVVAKATGSVTIVNNFSSASQQLVVGTRLSAPNGLIFKLDSGVTVPGMTSQGAGKITVKVTAAEVGDNYNVGMTTFKIVGFKGTSKYDKFSASSATAIAGGANGLQSVVSDDAKNEAFSSLEVDLKKKMVAAAKKQIADGYFMFDGSENIDFTETVATAGTSTATAKVTGNLYAIVFNKNNLSQYLASQQFTNEDLTGVTIQNLSALKFTLANPERFDAQATQTANFSLSGKARFVWPVDTDSLKNKLAGTKFSNRDKVFATFPNIATATADIHPFWVMSFPSNLDKITVELNTK